MIGVLNYGLGNVGAFLSVFDYLGLKSKRISSPEDFRDVTHAILPGVGSFDRAITKFDDSALFGKFEEFSLVKKCPVLGVCVGMQMMSKGSEEGSLSGFGWIDSMVEKLEIGPESGRPLPHMGWNTIEPIRDHPLFSGLSKFDFYFLHSFAIGTAGNSIVDGSLTAYGQEFLSAVFKDNILAVQFHPEKSHKQGVQLLKNFAAL